MSAAGLVMLQRRSEFLRVRNSLRWACAAFVVEARTREGWSPPKAVPAGTARFGLTVTKQLGGAVQRNRIRRRLRAVLQQTAPQAARPGFDYVVIARAGAGTLAFERLLADMTAALAGIHRPPQASGGAGRRRPPPKAKTS